VRNLAVTVLVLVLLGGTVAAFAVTQRLKLERSPVTAPRFTKHFSPVCRCAREVAQLRFRLRAPDTIDAAIIDSGGEVVRVLAENERFGAGPVSLAWDGRDGAGTRLPDGRYRLRVRLEGGRRTIFFPNPIFLDTRPPRVQLASVTPDVFSPDEDGHADRVRIIYRVNEPARGTLLVNGETVRSGKLRAEGRATMFWDGGLLGEVLDQGTYELSLLATDRAGNSSEPTNGFVVRLRFITVAPSRLSVRRGGVGRLQVGTDATTIAWTISRRRTGRAVLSGEGPAGAVAIRLPNRVRPGRYVVRATANGYSDSAVLRITAP
jgi:flagellar hook assembly protein FlgD